MTKIRAVPLLAAACMSVISATSAKAWEDAASAATLRIHSPDHLGHEAEANTYCASLEAASLVFRTTSRGPEINPSDVEQKASRYLSCCLEGPASLRCTDNTLDWLAWAHERQARHGQGIFFGETDVAAVGAAGLIIGGTKAAASTTRAWSLAALAPVIVEDIVALGPQSQVHYGAFQAFNALKLHYKDVAADLAGMSMLKVEDYKLEQACVGIGGIASIKDDKNPSAADVMNTEVANFKAYCKDYEAALNGVRPYRDSISAADKRVARQYIGDAMRLEDTFHKVSFSMQAPPSTALSIVLAAPFDALSTAIHSGKSINEYKARAATFDLEKDGLNLASPWPATAVPATLLPSSSIARSASAKQALTTLGAASAANDAMTRLGAVEAASTAALEWNRQVNQTVAGLSGEAGTYKMVFDFRAQKPSVEVEFTKAGSSKQ